MIGPILKKQDIVAFHPRLRTHLDDDDLSRFLAELLQSLYETEEQLEAVRAQIIIDQEQLESAREQLKKDQEAILEDKDRLVKFQSFIMKLATQIEESGQPLSASDYPLPNRKTAI